MTNGSGYSPEPFLLVDCRQIPVIPRVPQSCPHASDDSEYRLMSKQARSGCGGGVEERSENRDDRE